MSLDTAIKHNKEYRKKYRRSKAVDTTCRNHGTCIYGEQNRLFSTQKRLLNSETEKGEL